MSKVRLLVEVDEDLVKQKEKNPRLMPDEQAKALLAELKEYGLIFCSSLDSFPAWT